MSQGKVGLYGQHYMSFCDCDFPMGITVTAYKGHIPDLVTCRCGEDPSHAMEWMWQSNDADALVVGPDVTFHPIYSQGTAIVRGEVPLQTGMVHFWEMRILTALSGTDVMFGIGTDKVDLSQFKYNFVSALGTDNQSWGFSYCGQIQHKGEKVTYGQRFSQGCVIGVYLDRRRGYLEYFMNRRSLGVAYTNIPLDPNVSLYPMVCSTAAKSAIRLINSTSLPDCLQLRAFQALCKLPKQLEQIHEMPGLRSIQRACWFMASPNYAYGHSDDNELDLADEAVLPRSYQERNKRLRAWGLIGEEEHDSSENDHTYTSAYKMLHHHCNIADDHEFFDEYFQVTQ